MAEKDVHNKRFLFGSRLPTSEGAIDQGPQLLGFEVHQARHPNSALRAQ